MSVTEDVNGSLRQMTVNVILSHMTCLTHCMRMRTMMKRQLIKVLILNQEIFTRHLMAQQNGQVGMLCVQSSDSVKEKTKPLALPTINQA